MSSASVCTFAALVSVEPHQNQPIHKFCLWLSLQSDTQFLRWCGTGKDCFNSFTLVYVCSFLAL